MKTVLLIIDGWGVGPGHQLNPFGMAKRPNLDVMEKTAAFGTLQSSGVSVGLPWGDPGSSEVGHLTLGIGKVHLQGELRIDTLIQNKEFFGNEAIRDMFARARSENRPIHLVGAISASRGFVSVRHLLAILDCARQERFTKVKLHAFLDGDGVRISAPLSEVEMKLHALGEESGVATVCGSAYGLNDSGEWIKTARAHRLLFAGDGAPLSRLDDILGNVNLSSLEPSIIDRSGIVKEGDQVLFFHFEGNKLKQLIESFLSPAPPFLPDRPPSTSLLSLVPYQKQWPLTALFPEPVIETSLTREISRNHLKYLKVCEAAKENLLGFYFNGLTEEVYPYEFRKVFAARDSWEEIESFFAIVGSAASSGAYEFVVGNISVLDKILHRGALPEAVTAIEALDAKIQDLANNVTEQGGLLIVTSDHGGVENMLDPSTGLRLMRHSTNPSPVFIIGKDFVRQSDQNEAARRASAPVGGLSDIAPTVLRAMGIAVPSHMTGKDLTDRL